MCEIKYSHLKTFTKTGFNSLKLFNGGQASIKNQKQPSFLLGLFFTPSSPTHFSPRPQSPGLPCFPAWIQFIPREGFPAAEPLFCKISLDLSLPC